MNTFVRRLNSLLSLARESCNQRRKAAGREHRPAAHTRPRLALEALEDRILLSGNPPTLTLTNGNLYNTAISQSQPIDTEVASFAVRTDGNLYVLHLNNDLVMETPDGHQFADFGVVKAFGLRNDGNGYIEQTNNYLYLNTPSTNIPFGYVNAFGMRSDGNAYVEWTNNDLILNTPQKNVDFGMVNAFGMSNDGNGYFLSQAGHLFLNTPTQQTDYGILNPTGVRSDGAKYFWLPSGDLIFEAGAAITDLGVAQTFATTTDGRAYYEGSNGSWYLNTASGTTSLGSVQASGRRSDGATYQWFQNGDLIVEAGTTVFGDFGPVQAFAVTGDGRAYYEQANGAWWINTVSQNISLGGVQASGLRSDGATYQWFQNGDLIVRAGTTVFGDFGPVQAFAVTGDGRAYYELPNGAWWINTVSQNISLGSVQASGLRSDGATYQWFQNGDLIVRAGTTVFGDFGPVQAFAVTGDGRAYYELPNGAWWINTVSQNISLGGVQASGLRSDGATYQWFQNGDLIVEAGTTVFGDFGPVQAFAVTGDGRAYYELPNGAWWINTVSQNISLGSVQASGLRSDGATYQWFQNGDLIVRAGTTVFGDFGPVQAFAVTGDGRAYYELPNGACWINTVSQNISLGNVQASGRRSDGANYQWFQNGDLIVKAGTTVLGDFGMVNAFGMSNDGNGYFLSQAGHLFLNTPTQQTDYGILNPTGIRGDGAKYFWLPSRELIVVAGSAITDLGVAQTFATTTDVRAYYEGTNGSWYLNTASGTTSLGAVQASGLRSDGATYQWFQNGDLIVEAGTTVFGDFGPVQAFAVTGDGRAYYEQANGAWWINTVSQNISLGGVQASGLRSDGATYQWFQNGDLIVRAGTTVFGDFGIVKEYVQRSDGNAYYLQNGNLTLNTPLANPPISSNVQSFSLGSGDILNLILNPAILPSATAGQGYNAMIQPTAASGSSSFTLAPGAPSWLHLTSAGQLSGSTNSTGTYGFTVLVKNTSDPGFSATQSFTLTVNPAAIESFTVVAMGTATVGSGIRVTIVGKDHYGNVATGYNGTVSLSALNGQSQKVQSQNVTVKNGTATVTFTPNHSGTITLTVTAGSISGRSQPINVKPSLYYFRIAETVDYYTDDGDTATVSNTELEVFTQPITAATAAIAESALDFAFKKYLDDNGYDWFGLPTFTVLDQTPAN